MTKSVCGIGLFSKFLTSHMSIF